MGIGKRLWSAGQIVVCAGGITACSSPENPTTEAPQPSVPNEMATSNAGAAGMSPLPPVITQPELPAETTAPGPPTMPDPLVRDPMLPDPMLPDPIDILPP